MISLRNFLKICWIKFKLLNQTETFISGKFQREEKLDLYLHVLVSKNCFNENKVYLRRKEKFIAFP